MSTTLDLQSPSQLKVDELQLALGKLPQCEMPLTHSFVPGFYVRTIRMPKDALVVSKIHLTEHPFVITKGRVSVWNETTGVQHFTAPHAGITKPGTRRVLYVHEDCEWTTFHATDLTDPAKIEEQIILKHEPVEQLPLDARKALAELHAAEIVSRYRMEAPAGCDPQNTFATVAAVASVAIGATSIGYTMYNAANQPGAPNLGLASREVAQAQAGALPWQRIIAAEEQQGGSALRQGYRTSTNGDQLRQKVQNQIDQLQRQMGGMQGGGANSPQATKIAQLQQELQNIPSGGGTVYLNNKGQVVPQSEAMANFQGYGTADIEGQLAKQQAQNQLNLGAKYGVQYATEAAKEAALANPEGTAARAAEFNLLQQGPPPANPLSGQVQSQVDAQLQAGRGLDPMSQQLLEQSVANSNAARGGGASAQDVSTAMSQGYQGQQRLQNAINRGIAVAQSGTTPADIAMRRSQQNIANLGAFVGGQTPESQFGNLSGAAQGASPYYPGNQQPTMPWGADQSGTQYGVTSYQQQVRGALGSANPWMAGLSGIMSGIGSLGQL